MKPDDKYTDKGGAIRIVTDIINTDEEVGYRIEGIPQATTIVQINGHPMSVTDYPHHLQGYAGFMKEIYEAAQIVPGPEAT